jgi:hypothetical protein
MVLRRPINLRSPRPNYKTCWTGLGSLACGYSRNRNPWVQCGRSRTHWDAISKAVSSFPAELLASPQTKQCLEVFTGMDTYRMSFSLRDHEKTLNLPDFVDLLMMKTLVMRRGLGISGPKDLLFALLGIVGEVATKEHLHLISVDYNKTTKEVFENLAMYIIRFNSRNCNLLSHAERNVDLDQRCNGLSSWCPNWTSPGLPREQNKLQHVFKDFSEDSRKRTFWAVGRIYSRH